MLCVEAPVSSDTLQHALAQPMPLRLARGTILYKHSACMVCTSLRHGLRNGSLVTLRPQTRALRDIDCVTCICARVRVQAQMHLMKHTVKELCGAQRSRCACWRRLQ
eukprot:2202446-Amphidinium_carterae.2